VLPFGKRVILQSSVNFQQEARIVQVRLVALSTKDFERIVVVKPDEELEDRTFAHVIYFEYSSCWP
jgi:hypothetical protein